MSSASAWEFGMSRKVGLRTRDGAGNLLLDTTTAMFRILGIMTIRRGWVKDYSGSSPAQDMTGSYSDDGILLGEVFMFYRPASFQERDPLTPDNITFTVSGNTVSWQWITAIVGTTPVYFDISYGVR